MVQSSYKTLFAFVHVLGKVHKSEGPVRLDDLVYAPGKGKESELYGLVAAPQWPRHRRFVGAIAIEEREQGESDICHGAGHNAGQKDISQGIVSLKEKLDEAGEEEENRGVKEKGY
jgi:hypothetical protein